MVDRIQALLPFGHVAGALLTILILYIALLGAWVGFGRGSRKNRLFQSIALSGAILASLVVMELPVVLGSHDYGQTFGTAGPTTWLQISRRVNRPDPELLHVHWPDSEFRGEVDGNLVRLGIPNSTKYAVDVRYDKNGFRNDENYERADFVVIGDSFVEGAIMQQEATVSKQLEARVGSTVVNLGQSGYGLRQELVILRRYALPLKPKFVVWFFFGGNDLRGVAYYESEIANFDQLLQPRPMRLRSFVRNAALAVGQLASQPGTEAGGAARIQHGIFTRSDGSREPVYFGAGTDPWSEHDWDVMVQTLAEAKRLCDEAGATFILSYIPRKFRIYDAVVELPPGSRLDEWQINDLPEQLGMWARSAGIPYVDTTPILKEIVNRGEHPYLVDDVHWNATGHRVAAQAVFEAMRESKAWRSFSGSAPESSH